MDTVTCKHCSEEIASDSEACPACGLLLVEENCERHPDRAAKGICVVCGSALCADCNGAGDTQFQCEEHKNVTVLNGWAQVYTTSDDLEAQLIRENLEADGIDARILSQKDHFSLPVELGELSQVRVLVPAYSYREADELISEHKDDSGEVRFGEEEEPPVA